MLTTAYCRVSRSLLLAAGDNPERLRSEAAFAKLCASPRLRPRPERSGGTG
jgi:hypothetical protein